jgi:hypothetical protein
MEEAMLSRNVLTSSRLDWRTLVQPWYGRIRLNPPYGGEIEAWVRKFAIEYDAGRVTEAIVLVKLVAETDWFVPLHKRRPIQCQIRKRVHFDNHENGAPFSSVALYFGPHPERFVEAFKDRGAIYAPWRFMSGE